MRNLQSIATVAWHCLWVCGLMTFQGPRYLSKIIILLLGNFHNNLSTNSDPYRQKWMLLKSTQTTLTFLLYLRNSKFCTLSLKCSHVYTHFEELTENIIKSSAAVLVGAATPEQSFFSLLQQSCTHIENMDSIKNDSKVFQFVDFAFFSQKNLQIKYL